MNKPPKYAVTPHKLALAVLSQVLLQREAAWTGREETKYSLSLYMVEEISTPKSVLEKDFPGLAEDLSALPDGGIVVEWLLEGLNELQSPDHIFEFFADLTDVLSPPEGQAFEFAPVDRTSVIGIFLRQCIVAFNQMLFDGVRRLWDELQKYKDLANGSYRATLSKGDLDHFLDSQIEKMDKVMSNNPPESVEANIATIQSLAPGATKTHYLSYLLSFFVSNVSASVDSLHRHFDYYIQSTIEEFSAISGTLPPGSTTISFLPYATLTLAGVHIRFGHYDEALELIHETVRLVQERTDNVCLTYALVQLLHIAEAQHSNVQKLMLLRQIITKALDIPLSGVKSETLMQLGLQYALYPSFGLQNSERSPSGAAGLAVDPADDVSYNSLHHTYTVDTRSAWKFIIEGLKGCLTGDEANLLARSGGLRRVIWSLSGNVHLQATAALSTAADIPAQTKLALLAQSEGDSQATNPVWSDTDNGRQQRELLLQLAALDFINGKTTLALNRMLDAKPPRILSPEYTQWVHNCHEILAEMTTAAELGEDADLHTSQLLVCATRSVPMSSHHAILKKMLRMRRKMAFTEAAALLTHVADMSQQEDVVIIRIQALFWLARLHQAVGDKVKALQYSLTVLGIAEQYAYDVMLPSIKFSLASILLDAFGDYKKARALLEEAISQRVSANFQHILEVHLLQARSLLVEAAEIADPSSRRQLFTLALNELTKAELITKENEGCAVAALKDLYYWRARIYNELGQASDRNLAAKKFQYLSQLAESSPSTDVGSAYYLTEDLLRDQIKQLQHRRQNI